MSLTDLELQTIFDQGLKGMSIDSPSKVSGDTITSSAQVAMIFGDYGADFLPGNEDFTHYGTFKYNPINARWPASNVVSKDDKLDGGVTRPLTMFEGDVATDDSLGWLIQDTTIYLNSVIGGARTFAIVATGLSIDTRYWWTFSWNGTTKTCTMSLYSDKLRTVLVGSNSLVHNTSNNKRYLQVLSDFSVTQNTWSAEINDIDVGEVYNIGTSLWGTFIREDQPTTNYNTLNYIEAGQGVLINNERVGFMAFDISSVSGVVDSMKLALFLTLQNGGTITVQRVLRNDVVPAEMTWNEYKSGSAWATAGAKNDGQDYTSTNQVTFNPVEDGLFELMKGLTSLIQDAVDAGQSTLILRFADMLAFSGRTVVVISDQAQAQEILRPQLDVQYTFIQETPKDVELLEISVLETTERKTNVQDSELIEIDVLEVIEL